MASTCSVASMSDEEIFHKFRDILNKLCPQKFKTLAEQALSLNINSERRLKGCIDMLLTKILEDPNSTITCANLCKVMSTIKVDVATEEGKPKVVTFRRVLLTKCQQEFEKDKKDNKDREKMLAAIKDTEDPDIKKKMKYDLENWKAKSHERSLANLRLIGELFKLTMIAETIMHEIIPWLLRSSSDVESLECFTVVMTTVGKYLDKPEAKARMDSYFSRINEIIKKGNISPRIQLLLQDVLDLRSNKWEAQTIPSLQTQVRTVQCQTSAEFAVELTKYLSNTAVDNSSAFDWIKVHCPPPLLSSPEFVTIFSSSVVGSALHALVFTSEIRLQEDHFSKRAVMIKKYVGEDEDLQLRVLQAVQAAVAKVKHPPGVLDSIFHQLCDNGIVKKAVFETWREKVMEGYSALQSAKNFFDLLHRQ